MRYEYCGIVLDSPRALPFLTRASSGDAHVRITYAGRSDGGSRDTWDELYAVGVDDSSPPLWCVLRNEDQFCLRVFGIADYVFSEGGASIAVEPFTGGDESTLAQLLVDHVVPRAIHLRGMPCIHASAVELADGSAVAIGAPSGSGKSTLCAALTAAGAKMVSDDALRPKVEAGRGIMVAPAYPSVRLWPDSAENVFGSTDFPAASARRAKLRVERPFVSGWRRLSAIVVLAPNTEPSSLSRLTSCEALREVVSMVHRLVGSDKSANAAEFALLTELASTVPTYRLQFRHDYRGLADLVALVNGLGERESGFRELGPRAAGAHGAEARR